MRTPVTSLITIDEEGSARVRDTRSRVSQVITSVFVLGFTPEQMVEEYTHLTLADVHAALSYYYQNKQAIDDELEEERLWFEAAREAQAKDPRFVEMVERLNAYKNRV